MGDAINGYKEFADFRQRIASPLFINSFYLMGGPVASAGLGFVFWMLAARSTQAADIGIATAAIAGINLLMALSDLGLGTAIIHFASSDRKAATGLVNTIIALGWICISIATVIFLMGVPFWSPGLMPIRNDIALLFFFFVYSAFNYVLALQDAGMLSQGRASYVFWRNIACNLPSVLLVLPLVNLIGGHGSLFWAYGFPNVIVGLFVGLMILPRAFEGYRFFGTITTDVLGKIAAYGLANYAGNILWGIPAYVLPLIAINTLTAEETGYFFIIWTIANFALIAPRMVSYSLFAESSRNNKNLASASIHSIMLILVLVTPIIVVLWFWGDFILGLFGQSYINLSLLRLLLISIVPFSINSIYFVILRVRRRLKQIILFSALVASSILALASVFVRVMGIEGLAMGWLFGHSLAAVIVSMIVIAKILAKRLVASKADR